MSHPVVGRVEFCQNRPTRDCLECKRVQELEDALYQEAEFAVAETMYESYGESYPAETRYRGTSRCPMDDIVSWAAWLAAEEARIFA